MSLDLSSSSPAVARAGRIAFWCGVVLGVVLVLHAALVLFYRRRGRHPPELLEFPRVELFAMLLMTQPIGQSAASERPP